MKDWFGPLAGRILPGTAINPPSFVTGPAFVGVAAQR
jgi:hypothetical protein